MGAVCALPWIFPDGPAGRVACPSAGLQGWHHFGPAAGGARLPLVHPGHRHQGVLGLPRGHLRDLDGSDLFGNGRQPLHHRARRAATRRGAHQHRRRLQWCGLDLWADHRRAVLLLEGRRRSGTGNLVDPLRMDRRRGALALAGFRKSENAQHRNPRQLSPR